MRKTKFSFVVPIYNVERYLNICIDSVISQTFDDFECILVDDGSTDASGQICDAYAAEDQRIKVIHKENGGLVSARKAGAAVAMGEYIICLDGDDSIELDLLESCNQVLLDFSFPDVVCFDFFRCVNEKKYPQAINIHEGFYTQESFAGYYQSLLRNNKGQYLTYNVWGKAFKRDLYLKYQNKVDNQIRLGEDMCVTIPCLFYAKTIYFLKKPLYNYRINNNSMTRSRKKGFLWSDVSNRIEHFSMVLPLEQHDFYHQLCRSTVHSLFNVMLSYIQTQNSYQQIYFEINHNLQSPCFAEYIKHCRFSNLKENIALHVVKRRYIFLLWMVHKTMGLLYKLKTR